MIHKKFNIKEIFGITHEKFNNGYTSGLRKDFDFMCFYKWDIFTSSIYF